MNSYLLLLLLAAHLCDPQVIEVPVGVFFWRELTPQSLNFTDATDEHINVYYSISSQPFAGLPTWLSFYQRNSSSSGILYGTPTITDVGPLDVQVVALNKKLFDSVKLIISLNVVENSLDTEYSMDLFVTHNNFDTLLMGSVLANLNSVMQTILQSTDLLVEDVVHPTFRGDSLPLPTGQRQFEGVYVVFGNVMQDYDRASSEDMMAVMEMCRQGGNVDLSNLPLRYQSTQPFTIDWCRMNLTKKSPVITTLDTQPIVTSNQTTVNDDDAKRNVAIVISFLILFSVIVVISFVYVCYNWSQAKKRLGRKYKRQEMWKSTQSVVIANAQVELREMSASPLPDHHSSTTTLTAQSPSLPSLSSGDRMIDPPPYQYPLHLINSTAGLPETEITLEPKPPL